MVDKKTVPRQMVKGASIHRNSERIFFSGGAEIREGMPMHNGDEKGMLF